MISKQSVNRKRQFRATVIAAIAETWKRRISFATVKLAIHFSKIFNMTLFSNICKTVADHDFRCI